MRRSAIYALASFALIPPGACGRFGDDTGGGAVVSDSAGVPVVENPGAGAWEPGEGWTVEEVLSFGSTLDDDEERFELIAGIDVDSAGRIYVADSQAHAVRVFDADGQHVRTFGRPGAGPAELGPGIMGVFLIGDTVFVPDPGNTRLSRFTTDGTFLGSDRLDVTAGLPIRWDVASGPRLVAQTRPLLPGDTLSAPRGDPIAAIDPRSEGVDTLVVLPVGQSAQIAGSQPRIQLFAAEPMWDADVDGRLVTAMSDAWRFEIRDASGTVRRVVTRAYALHPVTSRDRRRILDWYRTGLVRQGLPPAAADQVLDIVTVAEAHPAFASLALGPRGSIWVQQQLTGDDPTTGEAAFDPRDRASSDWSVFGSGGRYLGDVTLPARFQLLRVVGDRIYGVARDEFDVQSVKVLRVVSSGEGGGVN